MSNLKTSLILQSKYGKICMYGGIVTLLNPISVHHCFVLKRDGGEATENNTSLSARLQHSGIHILIKDDIGWEKYFKRYITEYKSFLRPGMTAEEFIALKIVQEYRECNIMMMDKRLEEMEYEAFLTKDRVLQYRKRRY